MLFFLFSVSGHVYKGNAELPRRTGTGFIMRAVCLMYKGAVWRMNIIRVGCIARTRVALNMDMMSRSFGGVEIRFGGLTFGRELTSQAVACGRVGVFTVSSRLKARLPIGQNVTKRSAIEPSVGNLSLTFVSSTHIDTT
jgi:hypothetical protein